MALSNIFIVLRMCCFVALIVPRYCKLRKIIAYYPVELMHPVHGKMFNANVTKNRLSCFGNRDFNNPRYRDALICFVQLYIPIKYNCDNIFASRKIEIQAKGGIEILRVKKLPEESDFNEYVSINATRWLEISRSLPGASSEYRVETRIVPAEPIYLCVRSNEWSSKDGYSTFNIQFSQATMRNDDRTLSQWKALYHLILIIMFASIFLLPYLVSAILAFIIYPYGMRYYFSALIFSSLVVCLAPFMLTNHNRHLARLYLQYFYPRSQAAETKNVIRERIPFFQAIFFSSLLIFVGSIFSYVSFTYFGILNREQRNSSLVLLLCAAQCWFVFFLVRSFQRFVRSWIWIFMSIYLTSVLSEMINPMAKDELIVSILGVTFLFTRIMKNVLRFVKRKKISTKAFDYYSQYIPPLSLPLLLDYIFFAVQFFTKRQVYALQIVNSVDDDGKSTAFAEESIQFVESESAKLKNCDNNPNISNSRAFRSQSIASIKSFVGDNHDMDTIHSATNASDKYPDNNTRYDEDDDVNDDPMDCLEDLFVNGDDPTLNSMSELEGSTHTTSDFLHTLQNSVTSAFFQDEVEGNEPSPEHFQYEYQENLDSKPQFPANRINDTSSKKKQMSNELVWFINNNRVIIDNGLVFAPGVTNREDFTKILELVVAQMKSNI